MVTLDPMVDLMLRGLLAAIFATAAYHKLRGRATFEGQLLAYDLLPDGLVHPASRAIALTECAVVIFLLARADNAGLCAVVLMLVYACAMGINLIRGRHDIDCGCGGADGKQVLHWALVGRNLALALCAAALMLPVDYRPALWADYLLAAIAALTAFALYVSFNTLVAQWPATRRLKA
jgi:hypothetical protein|tara:strand:- start:349643 stop:350176 length:534 start_codon:yes stop_codon:yes gene_type:complete